MTGDRADQGKSCSSFRFPLLFVALALGYTAATGPFRAADEPAHFFRAYAISEGSLIAEHPRVDLLGSYLPKSLPKLAAIVADFPRDPAIQVEPERMARARQLTLRPEIRDFVHFPNAAMNSPLVYLPAVLGIGCGRLLGLQPLLLLYLARCFNAVLVGGVLGWGLTRIKDRAPFLLSIALFPMCLAQLGAVTADAVTFAIAFCWVAELWSGRTAEPGKAPGSKGLFFLFALLLSQVRIPYPLLGLLIFGLPGRVLAPTRAGQLRFLGAFLFLLIAPSLAWLALIHGSQVQMRPFVMVNPGAQLASLLHHPAAFLQLVVENFWQFGFPYWRQAVGVLGWLNFPLPLWLVIGFTLGLCATTCAVDIRGLRLTARWRIACFSLAAVGLFSTVMLIYLSWNRVGAPTIEGWQGRYLLPLLPLFLLALANGVGRRVSWLPRAALGLAITGNVIVILLLAQATYGVA